MQRLLENLKLKKIMAILLLVCTIITTFGTVTTDIIYADANDLRKIYLDLMSGKNVSEVNDISSLTTDELRCIALYLSNFYVPYATALDGDAKEENIESMVNALTLIGFREDTAENLVNAVYSASLNSMTEIYARLEEAPILGGSHRWGIGSSGDDPGVGTKCITGTSDNSKEGDSTKNKYPDYVGSHKTIELNGVANTFTPATLWIWNMDLKYADGSIPVDITTDNKSIGSSYYLYDGSGMNKVFTWNETTINMWLSMLCESNGEFHASASQMGYLGNAIANIPMSSDPNDFKDSNENTALLSIFTQKLYVDWVGNIICNFGNRRVVIYPACVNPYAFDRIGSSSDSEYNFVSSWGIRFLNLFCGYDKDKKSYFMEEDAIHNNNADIGLVLSTGSKIKANWDSKQGFFKWGGGTAEVLQKLYHSWGIMVDKNDDSFGDTSISVEWLKNDAITKDKTFSSLVMYDADYSSDKFMNMDLYTQDYSKYNFFSSKLRFKTVSKEIYGDILSFSSSDKTILANIFLTYVCAYANKDETTFRQDYNVVNLKFNNIFPQASAEAITWEITDSTSEEVMSFVYYLLHPIEGGKYVVTWFKNKISSILVGIHEDIVGATDSNSTTGMTRYLSFTGYATSPALKDIEWISALLDSYNNIVVFLIIFMSVVLLCYILIGQMSIQRAFIGVVLFGVMAFLPPVAINTTVDIVNRNCDIIYGDKFTFWAICQLQEYLPKLSNVSKTETVNDYISVLLNKDTENSGSISTSNGYSGAKVKWMSPKKINELSGLNDAISGTILDNNKNLSSLCGVAVNVLSAQNTTEDFNTEGLYLYRDLLDIYKYASVSYNIYTEFNFNNELSGKLRIGSQDANWVSSNKKAGIVFPTSGHEFRSYIWANDETSSNYHQVKDAIKDTSSLNAIRRGFLTNNVSLNVDKKNNYYNETTTLATSLFVNFSDTLNFTHENLEALKNTIHTNNLVLSPTNLIDKFGIATDVYFGLAPSTYDFTLSDFISGRENGIPITDINSTLNNIEDLHSNLSHFYYSLYSESPFYYFSYNIRDQFTEKYSYNYKYDSLDTSQANFCQLFLDNNQAYFFNYAEGSGDGYGELRDFMNMHDLFYYIMPMLQEGNDLVDLFDSVYGMKTYDDCSLRIDSSGMIHYNGVEKATIKEIFETLVTTDESGSKTWSVTNEEIYKLWHDYNVWTLFNAYTPWLDTMYDCDYADAEKISILGENYTVENPLDPSTYFKMDEHGNLTEGRYMIFSRSEMKYYGLTEAQLTQVERKIIEVQDNVYQNAIKLMDYYKMSDETLIESYAMMQLFEFNKVFSQTSLVSESYELFPQSYELKAFSYDAYMRLIVAEASGESLMTESNDSIYGRVIKNTSIFFGVALIVNDFIAVYLIPILKLAFLVLIFLISILLIIAASIQLEFNLVPVLWKSIASPLISYGVVSIGMAYLVSLFMGNGAEGITGGSLTISVGDPTIAVILMIIINVAVLVLYWKICKKCFSDFKTYLTAVANSISSAVVGACSKVAGVATEGKIVPASSYFGHPRGLKNVSSSAKQRGLDNLPTSRKRTKHHNVKPIAVGVGVGAGSQAVKAVAGMNKYDQKALGKANTAIGKASAKADIARHKLEKAVASGASDKKIERLQRQAGMAQFSLDKKKEYAHAIVNVGRRGARGIALKNKYDKLSSNAKGVGRSLSQFHTDFQTGAFGYKAGLGLSTKVNQMELGIRNTGNIIKRGALKTVQVTTTPIRVGKKVIRTVKNGSVQQGFANMAKKGVDTIHETGANIVKNKEEFKMAYKFGRSSMKNKTQFHKTT